MCYKCLFLDYTEWKGHWCYPFENTTWKSFADAFVGCSINPLCTQFYKSVLDLEDGTYSYTTFFYCKHGSKTTETAIADLYKKGKNHDSP